MSASDVLQRAERIYEERLRQELERSHLNFFVAIEPESGEHFLGRTLSEASASARTAYPERRTAVLRVGHRVTIHIGAPMSTNRAATATVAELDAWIDTGFTGELVLPQNHIQSLALPIGPKVRAGLADGSEVELDTFTCLLDWFGEWKQIEVVANQGRFPLLGVGLLLDRALHIDFCANKLTVE